MAMFNPVLSPIGTPPAAPEGPSTLEAIAEMGTLAARGAEAWMKRDEELDYLSGRSGRGGGSGGSDPQWKFKAAAVGEFARKADQLKQAFDAGGMKESEYRARYNSLKIQMTKDHGYARDDFNGMDEMFGINEGLDTIADMQEDPSKVYFDGLSAEQKSGIALEAQSLVISEGVDTATAFQMALGKHQGKTYLNANKDKAHANLSTNLADIANGAVAVVFDPEGTGLDLASVNALRGDGYRGIEALNNYRPEVQKMVIQEMDDAGLDYTMEDVNKIMEGWDSVVANAEKLVGATPEASVSKRDANTYSQIINAAKKMGLAMDEQQAKKSIDLVKALTGGGGDESEAAAQFMALLGNQANGMKMWEAMRSQDWYGITSAREMTKVIFDTNEFTQKGQWVSAIVNAPTVAATASGIQERNGLVFGVVDQTLRELGDRGYSFEESGEIREIFEPVVKIMRSNDFSELHRRVISEETVPYLEEYIGMTQNEHDKVLNNNLAGSAVSLDRTGAKAVVRLDAEAESRFPGVTEILSSASNAEEAEGMFRAVAAGRPVPSRLLKDYFVAKKAADVENELAYYYEEMKYYDQLNMKRSVESALAELDQPEPTMTPSEVEAKLQEPTGTVINTNSQNPAIIEEIGTTPVSMPASAAAVADTTVDSMISDIIDREGGFVNDPKDSGGATNFGVTIGTAIDLGIDKDGNGVTDIKDVELLTKEDAERIFKKRYFYDSNIDKLPKGIQANVFDMNVNAGSRSVRILQEIVGADVDGVIGPQTIAMTEEWLADQAKRGVDNPEALLSNEYAKKRREFYKWLATNRPKDLRFFKKDDGGKGGWVKRAEEFMSEKDKWSDKEWEKVLGDIAQAHKEKSNNRSA